MMTALPDDEQLADDIVGAGAYEATPPPKKEFLPWHRPRKQFVRAKQWTHQIEKLLNDFVPEAQTLRYLGLPGVDLLDLRHFHSILCEPRKINLRFLGFNSAASSGNSLQVELNISLDEVKKLPFVDPLSEVLPDDIRRIANENSIAFRRAQTLGPFDVINLDLCDGFGGDEPGIIDDTHYNAVARLLSLQVRNKNPWLLLLTTRIGQAQIHATVIEKLMNKCIQNLRDCEEFRIVLQNELSILDTPAFQEMTGNPVGLLIAFLIGISKWLLGLAVANNPQASMELKSVIGYKVAVSSPCEDIMSLAFRFDPQSPAISDPLGFVNQPVAILEECPLSAKIVGRVAKRVNADDLLKASETLQREMTAAMANLLEVARYNRSEYFEWLKQYDLQSPP
jgi:hypothetical protein